MARARAFRPRLDGALEDRALPTTSGFAASGYATSGYLNLSHFQNGLGHVPQGSMISLNQAFHEGFRFGWGPHQLDPGTVLVSAGSHEHNPRLFLMKANSFTVWDYRLSYPFQRVFTSADLADGSLARYAVHYQWPWASLLVDRVSVVPSKGLSLTGTVSGPFVESNGTITVGHGLRDPLAAGKSAKSYVSGLVGPIGPIHVTGTLGASAQPAGGGGAVPNGNLTLRSSAGWLKLRLTGQAAPAAGPTSFVDAFTIAKGTGTLRYAKGAGKLAVAITPGSAGAGGLLAITFAGSTTPAAGK